MLMNVVFWLPELFVPAQAQVHAGMLTHTKSISIESALTYALRYVCVRTHTCPHARTQALTHARTYARTHAQLCYVCEPVPTVWGNFAQAAGDVLPCVLVATKDDRGMSDVRSPTPEHTAELTLQNWCFIAPLSSCSVAMAAVSWQKPLV